VDPVIFSVDLLDNSLSVLSWTLKSSLGIRLFFLFVHVLNFPNNMGFVALLNTGNSSFCAYRYHCWHCNEFLIHEQIPVPVYE